jgi:hypothetical protein
VAESTREVARESARELDQQLVFLDPEFLAQPG